MNRLFVSIGEMLPWLAPMLVAPAIGSFLGVLIRRLPAARPVALARSCCDGCGHTLGPRDLVPLVSYLLSRGRCRYCGGAIGRFHPAVELAALAVAGWAVTAVPGALLWPTCLLGWILLALSWIDARHMILPDLLTLPLIVAGLLVTAIVTPDLLADHGLAAALGYLALATTALVYRRLRGREGLGGGDAKLLAALGAWVGLETLPVVLFLAACLGLAFAAAGALSGKSMTATTAIPFGPFLAAAGWLCWLYGDRMTEWAAAWLSCCGI